MNSNIWSHFEKYEADFGEFYDGRSYTGGYKQGWRNGKGEEEWADGSRQIAYWVAEKQHHALLVCKLILKFIFRLYNYNFNYLKITWYNFLLKTYPLLILLFLIRFI